MQKGKIKYADNRIPDIQKKDNFYGDRSVVLSKNQVESLRNNPISNYLYISDIGFYPNARNHFRKRNKGISENILIYCIDGAGKIKVEDITYNLESNSYFIISANKKHKYWSSPETPWSIYWLHFGGKGSRYFKEYYDCAIKIEKSSHSRINDRIKLFDELLNSLESGFSFKNINYANMCLNNLLASFFYVETFRLAKGYQNPNPVDRSILYMHQNINRFLKIEDLSDYVQLSESHYSKIFRNKTGSSPLDYFINLKMQEAIRLLTNQSLRIKEVAYRLGYTDPHYFTRVFTRQIGTSPGSFVKTRK